MAYAESADESADVEPLYRTVVELAPNFLEGRMALGSFYAGIDEIDERIAECINPQKSAVSRKTRRHQHQENSHAPNIALISEVDTQVQEIKRVRDDFSNESNQVPRRHLKIRRG